LREFPHIPERRSCGWKPAVRTRRSALEHRQRHATAFQDRVVEGAQIEALAQRLGGPRTQLEDSNLAELVRESLTGPEI
jgi:hypothetical protein